MTAFMFKRFSDRVEILSDGAHYLPDGTVVGMACKVRSSETVPLAIVGSGAVIDIEAMSSEILDIADLAASVDVTIAALAEKLAEDGKAASYDHPVRIAIGAFSETRGPISMMFDTFPEDGAKHSPFELVETAPWFGQGTMPDYSALVRHGIGLDTSLAEHGAFMFDQMRRHKMGNPARPRDEPTYTVGGHLDFTVVSAHGVDTYRIHEWPDVIGEKIDPLREQAA